MPSGLALFLNLDIFPAHLFLHFLLLCLSLFAGTNLFTQVHLFLHDRFLATQWNVHLLLRERFLPSGVGFLGGNAFDYQFFPLNLNRLIYQLGPNDLAQAHATHFDLAFADLQLFLR